MSDRGIALNAAGSAILGSIVTGFLAWKAGRRQAEAAETAGHAQAAALMWKRRAARLWLVLDRGAVKGSADVGDR
ncbi:hypothetical protein ABZY16_20285 [Streptomyces sp. NPDC006553]|uniref:hypothetical protein n=1 Tax=unclassified Streptomyces TaxID=2593676 RepID=UPI002250FAB7|nr:hypothetical protein [Streptomyces sp. NBC_00233]MCX5232701.1 hypothetical protein [Streptomyces sp. NBC_00233]